MVEAALNFHDTTVVSNTRPLKVNGQCELLAIPKSGEHFRGHAGLGIATRPPWGWNFPGFSKIAAAGKPSRQLRRKVSTIFSGKHV